LWSLIAFVSMIVIPGIPSAPEMTAGPGFAVSDYAVGFQHTGSPTDTAGVGPLGLAFDGPSRSANLFVVDYADGFLYKFPPGGGTASEATKVNKQGFITPDGLAFSLDFKHLYVTLQNEGVVAELNPATGERLPITFPSGTQRLVFPTGLATDPLTGDLFVSQSLPIPPPSPPPDTSVVRISVPTGTTSVYANVTVDGLTFDPRDGALYGGDEKAGLFSIDRSGTVKPINSGLMGVDGVGLAATRVPGQPPYLFANQVNGTISKIDLTTKPPRTTTVASGGTRGDFTTV